VTLVNLCFLEGLIFLFEQNVERLGDADFLIELLKPIRHIEAALFALGNLLDLKELEKVLDWVRRNRFF
jgi:hypothetical protein